MKIKILSVYNNPKALEEPVNDFIKQDYVLVLDIKVIYSESPDVNYSLYDKAPTYTAIITYRDMKEDTNERYEGGCK